MNKVECLRRMVEKISGKKGKGTTVTECLKELAVALGTTIKGDDICELLHQLGDIAPDVIGGGDDGERITINLRGISDATDLFYTGDYGGGSKLLKEVVGVKEYTGSSVKLTIIKGMFKGCQILESVPLFNTSKVTDASSMFSGCSALTTVPNYDFSNVTNCSYIFKNCFKLTTFGDNCTLNLPKANGILEEMFYQCSSITNEDNNFKVVFGEDNEITLNTTFGGMSNLVNAPEIIGGKITNMYSTFYNNGKMVNTPDIDVSAVWNFNDCFKYCRALKDVRLRNISVNIDFSYSTVFDRDDLLKILNNLATVEEQQTLTIGETNLAKLTEEDIAIATAKNWIVA